MCLKQYSTDVLSVKVEKRTVRGPYFGLAVGDGVKKYSLGAGGVETWNPSLPLKVKYVTWPG